MEKILITALCVLVIAITFWGWYRYFYNDSRQQIITVGNGRLEVEKVSSPSAIERGLSGRPSLSANQGMLFVFPRPDSYPFWMKAMRFPIDIIWVGSDKKIVGFSENVSPDSYPETFSPPSPVLYVLEVPAGWVRENRMSVGEGVTL